MPRSTTPAAIGPTRSVLTSTIFSVRDPASKTCTNHKKTAKAASGVPFLVANPALRCNQGYMVTSPAEAE